MSSEPSVVSESFSDSPMARFSGAFLYLASFLISLVGNAALSREKGVKVQGTGVPTSVTPAGGRKFLGEMTNGARRQPGAESSFRLHGRDFLLRLRR